MSFMSGIDITKTDTTQLVPLGLIVHVTPTDPDEGTQEWIYVQMTGAAAVEGSVLSRTPTGATYTVVKAPVTYPSSTVVGVAQHAIAQNSYGFILRRGVGEVLAGTGTIDVSEPLVIDTTDLGTAMEAGSIFEAMDTTSTVHGMDGSFGWALESVAATALATCYVNCRG